VTPRTVSDFPIGARVRVTGAAEWMDPEAKRVVGQIGTVTGHECEFTGTPAFLVVALPIAPPDDEWWFEPDEVEPVS